jgi:hypothetical protein
MKSRHILSYALIAVGVIFFLLIGLLGRQWLLGAGLGGVLVIAGVIFYRRGK